MKNEYEKLFSDRKQEARDLAILSLLLPEKGAEAFDEAWELLGLAAEFLNEKEAIREAEGKAYWESEEGKARHKEIVERFSKKVVE